jgi:PAS domain S-box-containing protein
VELRRTQGAEAALSIVLSDRGRVVMELIRRKCAAIQTVAYDRLLQQSEETRARANQLGLVSSMGGACLLGLLVFSTITIQRGTRRRLQLIGELQRSEEETAEARDWLQTTISSIGDGVITTDEAGRVLQLNAVAQRLTGWTQEDANGKPLEEIFIIHNEYTGAATENPVMKALRDGVVVGLANHTKLTTKDGREFPIDDSAAPIRDTNGNIAGVVLVFRDITERKAAEEALTRALEFDEAVLNNMGEGLFTVNSQGLLTSINPAGERLFGWSFEELRGRKMHDMTHHRHPDGTPFPVEECAGFRVLNDGDNPIDLQDVFIRKDGTFFDVTYSCAPLKSGDDIAGLVVVFRDVSERQRLKRALRSSEESYRAIGASINYGVWTCDPDGRNTYASDSFLKLAGISQEQCSDFGWGSTLHPDDAEQTIAAWKECARRGDTWSIEHRVLGVDGRYHWILARGVPLRDERGHITSWAGINLDIDQLKANEEGLRANERELLAANLALVRANDDLNQFAFAASHDLQEPLRMITSYSQLLVKGFQGEMHGDAPLYLNFIREGTKRMRNLLADLLAYTQLSSEKNRSPLDLIDLNRVCAQAIDNCKNAIEESQAVVICDPLPAVPGHETHFLQLLQNLIGNAIKYRGAQPPKIRISADETIGVWRLTVADNGIGIDPQYHQKIFGVFKRLHSKEIPGTGIGLAICQRVVDRYGGRIWVESQLSQGATFCCTLPRVTGGTDERRSV